MDTDSLAEESPKETYLGDGVYASFDGFQIQLRTDREGMNVYIYLDPGVWEELQTYGRVKFTARAKAAELCGCWRCAVARNEGDRAAIMRLCPICGNKRCPHVSDHELVCTGSNDPGQEGSIYA